MTALMAAGASHPGSAVPVDSAGFAGSAGPAISAEDYPRAIARGYVAVDIRSAAERSAGGALPGALAIAPEHVVSRLDPASPRHLAAADTAAAWLLISDDGDLAVMAGHALRAAGVEAVAHVAGGFRELLRGRLLGAGAAATHLQREAAAISAH